MLYNVLISGKVPGEKKVGSEEVEDDEMVGDGEGNLDRSSYVLFLKDEEEGQRLQGGARAVNGVRVRAAGESDEEEEDSEAQDDVRVRDPVGYLAFRRRLEGLVNKLISPICQLKDLR